MAYTKSQAKKIAEQIHTRFGAKVSAATQDTPVPPEFVAGLIGVEAGKDRQDRISETATRFEPGVYDKLVAIRAGRRKSWSHIKQVDIKDASGSALRNLATSFGLCQVMGWHTIHNLNCTIAELRDPNAHLKYAVQLLLLNSKDGDFERKEYVGEFKEWNSGSETGKTYHADYVANAGAVMDAYRELGPVDPLVSYTATEEPPEEEEDLKADLPTQEPAPPAAPQAPKPEVTPVAAPPTSIATKIGAAASAAGPVIAATGLKIGGVEFNTGGQIAIAAVIIVGMIVGAWLWNQSQERAFERQRLSMEHLASETKGNVIAAGSKV